MLQIQKFSQTYITPSCNSLSLHQKSPIISKNNSNIKLVSNNLGSRDNSVKRATSKNRRISNLTSWKIQKEKMLSSNWNKSKRINLGNSKSINRKQRWESQSKNYNLKSIENHCNKHSQRNYNSSHKTADSIKLSKQANVNQNKNKIPYGLKSQFKSWAIYEFESKSIDLDKYETFEAYKQDNQRWGNNERIKIVDNLKKLVPTNSEEFKRYIENEHKRHSWKFAQQKYQDEVTNRLLNKSRIKFNTYI